MQSPPIITPRPAKLAIPAIPTITLGQGLADIDDPGDRAVEIPYMHAAVFAAAVEVLLARGGGGREVASYQGFEDFVA
jgi:hypothetical protein